MVIGQFNDSFPPAIDGVANVAINYCRFLDGIYGKCYMVTLNYPESSGEYPFEVKAFKSYAVPFRNQYRWGIGVWDRAFWRDISKIPFDIVHAHCPFSTGMVARRIAKSRGIPLVATLHSKYRDDFKRVLKSDALVNRIVIKRIVKFLESADDVWTVNESMIDVLREYGYDGEVFVMNNASDIPVTDRNIDTKRRIYEKYNLDAGAPLFLYVGQHIPQKNIDLILNALSILNAWGFSFNMLFVGDGPQRHKFMRKTKLHNIDKNARFTGIITDRSLLKEIYLASDAVLFPSLYDTSSLVIKEASSCFCPAVLIEGSTTAQGVVDGENGFLAKNNPEDYAAKIRQIIQSRGLAEKAGFGACKTLYISWQDVAKKVGERYLELIKRAAFKRKIGN